MLYGGQYVIDSCFLKMSDQKLWRSISGVFYFIQGPCNIYKADGTGANSGYDPIQRYSVYTILF